MRPFKLACGVLLFSGVAAMAQVPDRPETPMIAGDRLGEIEFPNSGEAVAQAPFLRGVKLLHNFEYSAAVESFQAAEKADPNFALAYWGEAMAHNYTLWAEQHTDSARAVLAKLAPTRDARAAKTKTPRERMWLDAVETLYGGGTKFERDVAYADKMDALAAAYPTDVEAQVFDALATLGRSHGVRNEANYLKSAAILEKLFAMHRQHPGVVHYMIHSYDDPAHAKLGLKAALLYDKIAPESPHALHMTSHIFLALGMWPETIAANRAAAARAMAMMAGMPGHHQLGGCGHGSIWLVYAELQMGKDASQDIDRCRASAFDPAVLQRDKTVIGSQEAGVGGWSDMVLRRGIETGEWPTEVALPSGHFAFAKFNLAYARLLASSDNAKATEGALADMMLMRSIIAAAQPTEAADDEQLMPWLDRAIAQGRALQRLSRGQTAAGLRALRETAETEASMPPVFGPPALEKPSHELLGDELLKLGRKAEAADAYHQALTAAPNRRLSVIGLKAARGF